ncbi:hypothetical protein AXG93_3271s1080 [Marchantia polymorpha subsp. ruderalis]|uniref:No apical meristem-associated C-terminal domain-containing protein n=3 Tax=Marchantia polymorpha TaxID=3197 RepID=A0A176VQC3_MARPO|nr:hypothetical protein AXG93_3271s1080 [Marchantia polymorpha subsp. ruderalis]
MERLKIKMTEYQFVKEWNRKSGTFSSLTPQPKRTANLASSFDIEAEELLDSYQGNIPVDGSMRNSPSAGEMGKDSAAEEENEQAPSRGGDREHVSTARKRKRASSSALAGVVAAFQEMSAGIMRIEKENSERAKEAHEMAKDAHELEKRKFEFQQRKVEREEERADKFVGVLGQIAGAFRKMAEKM